MTKGCALDESGVPPLSWHTKSGLEMVYDQVSKAPLYDPTATKGLAQARRGGHHAQADDPTVEAGQCPGVAILCKTSSGTVAESWVNPLVESARAQVTGKKTK